MSTKNNPHLKPNTSQSLQQDEHCDEPAEELGVHNPHALNVQVNPTENSITFEHVPGTSIPQQDHTLETCTMRLQRRGGRACETCALALENRVQELKGVELATASYMGGVLKIKYDSNLTSSEAIVHYVRSLNVPLKISPSNIASTNAAIAETKPRRPLDRLNKWFDNEKVELYFMVITFFAMISGLISTQLDSPVYLSGIFYTLAYVTGGAYGLRAGLESLRDRTIDVDLLMIIAAVGAALVRAPFEGAMLLFLFSLSNVLQTYALDRTRNAIRALMKLRPSEALTRRGNETVVLPIEEISVGDHIIVRPGERIPLDGMILEGTSSVDQAPITGESIPVSKGVGDTVLAGTINQKGALEVSVTRLAEDSTIAKLIQLVEEAQSEKAKTQRFIDKAEQYYAMGVIVLTSLAILIPMLFLQEGFDSAFYRAMTLMVAASPCALVISTPATVLSAIGNGARRGVLFKGGAHVERAASIRVIAFDKTGTLTVGNPTVTDMIAFPQHGDETQLLTLAAAVEAKSEHPLAQAIVQAAKAQKLALPQANDFQSETGKGVWARVNGTQIHIGNARYFAGLRLDVQAANESVARLENEGKTSVLVAEIPPTGAPGRVLGVIAIADTLRENVPQVIQKLKSLGVERVVMLTGDNQRVAQAIAAQAGLDEHFAELLPEDKLRIIKNIEQTHGPVAMVGDGVNDAPALAAASIGIAMGAAGTDVALETADIVLMADDLANIPYVIGLSHQTRKTLVQNLAFALGIIIVLIGAVLGFQLALPLSVIGHEGSTVLVSLNGMRLLGYRGK